MLRAPAKRGFDSHLVHNKFTGSPATGGWLCGSRVDRLRAHTVYVEAGISHRRNLLAEA